MYTYQYNQAIEMMKTSNGLAKDYRNYQRCKQVLQQYERNCAWECLQDMIREYKEQIEACSSLEEGTLVSNVSMESYSDNNIRGQIAYIGQRIPLYVMMREGKKEAVKRICEWLDHQQVPFY